MSSIKFDSNLKAVNRFDLIERGWGRQMIEFGRFCSPHFNSICFTKHQSLKDAEDDGDGDGDGVVRIFSFQFNH